MTQTACVQCGHVWKARLFPRKCPNRTCQSIYWDQIVRPLWELVKDVGYPNECVEWENTLSAQGYGQVLYRGTLWNVHRLSYMLHRGPLPDGILVCHSCDNRKCYNPRHLFLGTYKENMQDSKKKGRNFIPTGELSPRAILTERDVLHIRSVYRPKTRGLGYKTLAREYGVSNSAMRAVINRKSWAHI